jgi:CMP-N-acetylneuraminic acid synthetase
MNVALICARGGSKGLPGKNLLLLQNKPLIAHAIETAKKCHLVDHIIVSTDDAIIAKVAKSYGAETPFLRPKHLAQDNSAEIDVWRHAVSHLHDTIGAFNKLIVLPPTGPLRRDEDVTGAIVHFGKNNYDLVLTVTESHRNPSFNMLKKKPDGTFSIAMPVQDPPQRRQDATIYYDVTTNCYVANPDYILRTKNLLDGKVGAFVVHSSTAVDIDKKLDFKIAEFLFGKNFERKENE